MLSFMVILQGSIITAIYPPGISGGWMIHPILITDD